MRKVAYLSALVGAAFMILMPMVVQARVPTIRIIDWVQGRPEIPHPAVNGKDTMLQAILEARACGTSSGDAQFRWDYNADGDFDDGGEGWTDAGVNSGSYYFHYAMKDFRLPTFLGDTVTYPKIQARCRGTNPADPPSAVMPVLVRVDRMCTEYPQKRDGGCGPDDNLLLTKQTINDRAVDRAMWWLTTQFTHWTNDEHGHNVHTCQFDNYFGHGQALNVFIRRSHGAGPFRDLDPLFEHVVQCGIENNFNSWSYNGGSYRLSSRRLGYGSNWMSYASTALGEPVAGFGDGDYTAKAGEGSIVGRSVRSIAQGIANGLLDCSGSHHGGRYWHYSCGTSGSEDLSTSGWAPESLRIMTRKLGTDTNRGKGWHMTWLRPSTSHGNNHGAYRNDGGCGCRNCCRGFGTSYHISDSSHQGYRGKLAGNALVSYGYANSEVFSPDIYGGTDCWNCDINWQLREHWIALSRLHITNDYNGTGSPWGMYYLYAATKGLRSFIPEIRYLASFQSSSGYQTTCNRGDHDACDLTTTGYDINDNYNGGCGNDGDCKAGNYCRGGRCKVVLEEGVCLAAHYKHSSNDNGVSSGTGRTNHWQCGRDWALEFAQFLVPLQADGGYFNNYNQYAFGRKDTNVLTALGAQIIQTWLETWAIARAIPQATTPGIPVTFNHSWSHILDPGTHIKQYQWDINSLDGLWWQDRNCDLPKKSQASCENDGSHNYRFQYADPNNPNLGEVLRDEKVVGFVTRDVGKKGDYHPGNYFNSEELMDMVMTDFVYTYTNAISWDDVAKIKVTLRTVDTEDRPVVDDKSVTVKLSYDNHKPVIVAHPLGTNEIYSGYLGLPMYLDAKTGSYDVDQCVKDKFGNPVFGNCGNREVFPGNDEKPAGFPDKITKICFDLNRNGTFCENGEVQVDLNANPPIDEPGVTFTPEAGVVKVGELTGIPVMVCDDGRWNGRCWAPGDGAPAEYTAGQNGNPPTCTLCAYGSASVKAVENEKPPQVPDWQPDPRKAEATLVLDTSPGDDESFDLTDHTGRTTRFVFDNDSDKSDGTRQVPTGKITVSGRPVDGETFVISDYANKDGIYFVFLDDTDNADGTAGPKTIIGIPHVRVGFKTANNPAAVAQRIASAINSKSIDTEGYDPNNPRAAILPLNVRADVVGTEVRLTMLNNGVGRGADPLRPDHSNSFPQRGGPDPSPSYYQYVNMDLVTNSEGTDFAGGMIVGMQNTNGNVEKIMENLASAIVASDLAFGKVTQVGRAVELEQASVGFSGNTQVSTDSVSGLRTQERGEQYCGNFGQTCCDGVAAPKCGDGSGCVANRCVTYGGTFAQDGADNCVVRNSIMAGEPDEGDGCACPDGLTATKIGEFDQANPANAGGAVE